MSKTDLKDAVCREIAERRKLMVSDFYLNHLPTSDDFITPDPRVMSALREAYDAGAKAQREQDASIGASCPYKNSSRKNVALQNAFWKGVEQIKEAIRQGRQ